MKFLRFPLLFLSVSTLLAAEPGNTLIPNGDFENGSTSWAVGNGVTVEEEDGNHFLRIQSPEPNTQVQAHRKVAIPAGTQKVKVSFRTRYENIVPGEANWHVGSLVMHFRDSSGAIVKPDPKPFPFKGKSNGWIEKDVELDVPEGAVELEFLLALFRVQQGTIDFDDIVVLPE
jgi:hypothetical protein